MQDQPIIDHIIFRKLFAESFSSFSVDGHRGQLGDEYIVEPRGVRWHETEDDYLQSAAGRLSGPSDAQTLAMLEMIRDAELPFPCSPSQVLAWIARSADIWTYVPDWLREALAQDDAGAALRVLSDAADSLEAEADTARVNNDPEAERSIEHERGSLRLAIEAFEEIGRALGRTGVVRQSIPADRVDYQPSKGAKTLQVLVVAAVNGLQREPCSLGSQQVIDWILEHKKDQVRKNNCGDGYEYCKGVGWNPLTADVVGKQLKNLARTR